MNERLRAVPAPLAGLIPVTLIALALTLGPGSCDDPEDDYCGLGTTGDSGGSDEPWIEVYNQGQALADGQTIGLVLGGQGACMFELDPYVGGYDPGGDYSEIDVVIDLDDVAPGPGGHFYSQRHATFVGCEDPDVAQGGSFDPYISTIQMLIDENDFPDGSSGQITFTLKSPDGRTAEVSAAVTLSTNDCQGLFYP